MLLAQQELDRAKYLVQKGFQTKEVLDQRQQQFNGATALLDATKVRVVELERALDAARHDVELYTVQIEDNTLVAPRDGRIQYRVANIGEVLPAGGHVFAMLDTSNVYMDIYLPTAQAGRVKFGAEARIVLDAYPKVAIPAKVVFISSQAQFTPKTVETQNERQKLMFRIRVQIDPERLRTRAEIVGSHMSGSIPQPNGPIGCNERPLERRRSRSHSPRSQCGENMEFFGRLFEQSRARREWQVAVSSRRNGGLLACD